MRFLTGLTIAMGVLIVLGTTVLVVAIGKRIATHGPIWAELGLDEPAGTRIAGMTAVADRLAIDLEGGGPGRVVLIDPRSGKMVGRIFLTH